MGGDKVLVLKGGNAMKCDIEKFEERTDPNESVVLEYIEAMANGTLDAAKEAARAAELVEMMISSGLAERHKHCFDELVKEAKNLEPRPPVEGFLPSRRRKIESSAAFRM